MIPPLAGTIERRLLVNFRADPEVVARQLPDGFRPHLVGAHAIVGICIIDLRLRVSPLPRRTSIRSCNGAHRLAVIDPSGRPAVFIPRRDSASAVVAQLGGRVFPAAHHRADLAIATTPDALQVRLDSTDGTTHVDVHVTHATGIPAESAFRDTAHASAFFEGSPIGYSPNRRGDRLDAVELLADRWTVAPMRIDHVVSSFFDDPARFPPGSITADHALEMRDIPHRWRVHPSTPLIPRAR